MNLRAVVLDTSVVVSGLICADTESPTHRIVEAVVEGRLRCVISQDLVTEYRRILLRPRVQRRHGLAPEAIDRVLVDLVADAVMRAPTTPPKPGPDPNDHHLWALLAAHRRAVLVTGDKRLIDEAPEWASVVSPRTAIDWLTE